ncbi:unnamed protein product [Phaeothamnion confervicola]
MLLPPAHFGPKIKDTVRRHLIEQVEGTSLGKHGFVITVVGLQVGTKRRFSYQFFFLGGAPRTRPWPCSQSSRIFISFPACVWGEVQQPEDIQLGVIEYDTGYVNVLVKYSAICFRPFPNEVMDATVKVVTQLGFFAEVGPLNIFVSNHSMPADMTNGYDAAGEMWVSDDKEVEIKAGSGIRLRIMGVVIAGSNLVS